MRRRVRTWLPLLFELVDDLSVSRASRKSFLKGGAKVIKLFVMIDRFDNGGD